MIAELTTAATASLTDSEVATVHRLVARAAADDGFPALNEAALLHLRHPHPGVRHVLARSGATVVGYGQLDEGTGQMVVHPEHRRAGVGSALLRELLAGSESPLRLWAMGDTDAARGLAGRFGLSPARELLIMTRPLLEPVPEVPLPDGTTVRTFVVGQDEAEWLAVNARAFSHHPEQGQLTQTDLADRMVESWFDPSGFFLAVRDTAAGPGRIVGFHWTKQHPDQLGEVYVLGVDPEAGGGGLGRALLARGLRHLRGRGNTSVQLYVEADHARAVALYAGSGFSVAARDVMYAQS